MSLFFKKMRSLHSGTLLFFIFFFISTIFSQSPPVFAAGSATLSWNAPATNEDGTPLTDLAGYKIYYGTASRNYTQNIDVHNVIIYTITNLTEGLTYYFAVTAYDRSMNESGYSNEVMRVIPSIQQNSLNVTKAGTGIGTVTSSPAGISCGSDCSETYNAGTSVTLTASADSSSTFSGWSGACTGTGSCVVAMDAAKAVTATFTLRTYTITATAGSGGSITPSGSVVVNHGAGQSFTISPNANYTVGSVVVDGSSVGSVTTYTFTHVTANHTISASFTAIPQNSLNITKSGNGTGVVTSSPAGISCGSDCSETYNAGTSVTLTASADSSSTFSGWSGACTGTGSCVVAMDAAKAVTATFTLRTYTITATAGSGGSITPSGSVVVNHGAGQSFTISPNASYTVGSVVVDGSSQGAVTSYTFTNVTAAHTISASFNAIQQNSLNVTKGGTGTGTVTSTPAGINCGLDCTEVYTSGTVVTLSVSVDTSSTFSGWSGACTGTGSCVVTMDAAKAVTATFTLKTYTITATAGSGGSITPSGSVVVNHGASRSFTISPNASYTVGSVLVDGSSHGAITSYTFTNVTGAHTISVSFSYNEDDTGGDTATDLPKTGQTISYASGDDGIIQAGIEWPAPRFTDNGDGTITDNLTGLMWLKDGGCLKKNWSAALSTVTEFNTYPVQYNCSGYTAEYADWRLPNVKELESLINYGVADSAGWLISQGFVNTKSSSYWSSTTYQGNTKQAWTIKMSNGIEKLGSKKARYYIFLIRTAKSDNPYEIPKTMQEMSSGDDGIIQAGIEWPAPRFTDNGDGTITDNLTGLMWLKDGGCLKKNWSAALSTVTEFNTYPVQYNCSGYTAEYADWRLPNVKELESLINYGVADSAGWLISQGFVNTKSSSYWSSTTYQGNTKQAWTIKIIKANKLASGKSSTCYGWPVRGGILK